jgi:hypothetical protein
MAEELSRETLDCACRTCGTSALIRDWSCGCRTVSIINDRDRHYDCTNFSDMAYSCGEGGGPRGHDRGSGSSASTRSYDDDDRSDGSSGDYSSSSSGDYSGGDDSLWGCLPLVILIAAVMMFAPRNAPVPVDRAPRPSPPPPVTQSVTGEPLRDTAVAERCSRAPYHSMIMPPGAPDWTEWFDVPAGCAVHMENGSDRLGSNLFVECRSEGQSSRNACDSAYSAVRFQTRNWDMRDIEIIGFTSVPRAAADRPHWSEEPTDLTRGMRAPAEPPAPVPDRGAVGPGEASLDMESERGRPEEAASEQPSDLETGE